jgi:beta-glucosidase
MLLNRILRDEWGFRGMVISDWGGVHSTVGAVTGGLNVEMPGSRYMGEALLDSVKAGVVPESVIDTRVREILRVRLTIAPIPATEANKVMTSQPAQQQIAYEVAAHSIVLLKNEGDLLPIDLKKVKSIAVIGDNAVRRQSLGGVGAGVKALYEVTPLEGITNRLQESNVTIKWAQGYRGYTARDRYTRVSPYSDADPKLVAEAVQLAKASDLVIFVGGNNREVETEGSDRTSITLPMGQDELLQKLAAANPRIVAVMVTGAPLDLRRAQEAAPAMLISWFNGSEGGNAVADVLLGKVSPSGKLPFTFPLQLDDSPAYKLKVYPQEATQKQGDVFVNLVDNKEAAQQGGPVADYAEGIFVGYRWFDTKEVPVLYPFGHGLSYTTFTYSDLQVRADEKTLYATLQLSNDGPRSGEEVVQLYVGSPDSQIERPLKELKGFRRIALQPGEKKEVEIQIPLEKLRHWDEAANDWKLEAGAADVLIGSSSKDIRLSGTAQIAAR